jgi:hypothetical protein
MPIQHPFHKLDADDQKVFKAWLRRTVMAYVALVLCCVAVVTVQAMTHTTNVAWLLADSITQAPW